MWPVLFHIGSFPIYSYSAFVVLAYLACLGYGLWEAKRQKLDPAHVVDVSLWLFGCGMLGARLLFIMIEYPRFLADPREIYRLWNGGLIYYGGLGGAVLGGVYYLKRHGLPLGTWSDFLAPTAMIMLVVGRVGCFLNGCCYGKIAPELPWGVVYPASHPALGLAQYPVHPAPLYESLSALAIVLILVGLSRRRHFPGQVFWSMVLLYSLARFILENFRGDPRGVVPGLGLSTSQGISLAAGSLSIVVLFRLYRRSKREAPTR